MRDDILWLADSSLSSKHAFRVGSERMNSPVRTLIAAVAASLSTIVPLQLRADEPRPVSFRHEVLPALTKSGCSAGTCHGTPAGKNGFRLSLRGYDPGFDIHTLTREVQSRRVNPLRPAESLLLLKATAQVPHEGGRRFATDSVTYRLLHDWIAQGAKDDSSTAPELLGLEVTPADQTVEIPAAPEPLRVFARFADGARREVTHLARLSVHDDDIASVAPEGQVTPLSGGEAVVSAEYCNQFATARVIVLEQVPGFQWSDPPENNEIDRHVFARLKLLRIEPSPLTTDAEFLRRVYLDAIGRLPTPDEARRFLDSSGADRRAKLIDELLDQPEFADWWALKWADRLGCNQRFVGKDGAIKYHQWIRHAMASNMPEDEFAYAILTADGPNYSVPEAGFWRRLRRGGIGQRIDPLLAAEEISQLFLGVRIQCARCHNHPAERWTQDDFYGLAAFFPRVRFKDGPFVNHQYDKENTIYITADGEVRHPRTGQPMSPHVLDGEPAEFRPGQDRREVFARWVIDPENPYFARASVNRIWYHLFGRGLVEPVDDFRGSNPPSHPELLDDLAADFARDGFDRKRLIRTILNSRVYQLSSQTTPSNAEDDRYFSHARVRLLQAEQLLDAVSQAAGAPERFPGQPLGTPAVALPDGEYKHPFLEAFGRPPRASACECERDPETNLLQALQLVSGRTVSSLIRSDAGRAARLASSLQGPDEILNELFLATLTRHPTAKERELLKPRLVEDATRRQAVEDILWMLVNHSEFLFQH